MPFKPCNVIEIQAGSVDTARLCFLSIYSSVHLYEATNMSTHRLEEYFWDVEPVWPNLNQRAIRELQNPRREFLKEEKAASTYGSCWAPRICNALNPHKVTQTNEVSTFMIECFEQSPVQHRRKFCEFSNSISNFLIEFKYGHSLPHSQQWECWHWLLRQTLCRKPYRASLLHLQQSARNASS